MKHSEAVKVRDQLVRELPDSLKSCGARCCTAGSFIVGVVPSVGAEKALAVWVLTLSTWEGALDSLVSPINSGLRWRSGWRIIMDFHKIWQEQCEGSRTIRERFGVKSRLDYLVGENFADLH